MATETLRPGAVTVWSNPYNPGVVSGAPPQWADDSDDTYATTYTSLTSGGGNGARASAPLSPMVAAAADVTGITLRVRLKTSNSGGATGRRIGLALAHEGMFAAGEFAEFAYVAEDGTPYNAPADSLIHDLTLPLNAANLSVYATTLPTVVAKLAAGGIEFHAFRYSGEGDPLPGVYGITVYEMWLEVTHAGVEPPTPTARLIRPPLRYHPRSDGLGMSSVRRVDANRSTQASLRRAGGTYF